VEKIKNEGKYNLLQLSFDCYNNVTYVMRFDFNTLGYDLSQITYPSPLNNY
jgi:hypothetical protein